MKKGEYLKKFFLNEYNYYKESFNTEKNILLVDRQRYDSSILISLIALALNKKYKMNVIILSDLKKNDIVLKIYKKLGFKKFLQGALKVQYLRHFELYLNAILLSFYGVFKIIDKGFLWFIKNYKIRKIPFGDLIYDTNIRKDHRYINTKIDLSFIKLLISSTFRILLLFKYIKKYKISKIVTGSEFYSYNSGVALRIASYLNIDHHFPSRYKKNNYEISNFTKEELFLGKDNYLSKSMIKIFKKFNPGSQEIINFYKERKKAKKRHLWTQDDFIKANKNSKKGEEFIKKMSRNLNKKILYASHAFSDAVHQKGINYIFKDFYEQLEDTLQYVQNKDSNNYWIFRAHPSGKLYGEDKIFKKLVKKYKKHNIFICPSSVPIKKLYDICDLVVTGMGTTGIEFICEGKEAILAGASEYTSRNLTPYFAKNKFQYFNFLNEINNIKKPNKNRVKLAKKLLYFFESGYFLKNSKTRKCISFDNQIDEKKYHKIAVYGYTQNLNSYLKLSSELLKENVIKSNLFNKILKII